MLINRDADVENRDADVENRDADVENRDADVENRDADVENRDADVENRDADVDKILNNSVSTISKSRLLKTIFFILYNFELDHFFLCWICKEKYLQTCGSFKSQNTKKIGSANHKFAKRHICKRCANQTNYLIRKFAALLLAELICGPLTSELSLHNTL
jgi:hypothetical protein